MGHTNSVGFALLNAGASLSFENHDRRIGQPTRRYGRSHLTDERSGRPWSISPPPSGARSDDIRSINKQHGFSLDGAAEQWS
jgi:hypothetical protein